MTDTKNDNKNKTEKDLELNTNENTYFGSVRKLSKIELITIIASATLASTAQGACACSY